MAQMTLGAARKMNVISLEPAEPQTKSQTALKVFLVEDDEGDAFLIKKALRAVADIRQIVHSNDGIAALHTLDEHITPPDVAIIDLHMPRKNGFDLLVNLACDCRFEFPTIVLTSSVASSDRLKSQLRGADLVYTKPPTLSELENILFCALKKLELA